ncbi:peptidyl-tRNA hydrolase PTH2-domain-containing protein [Emericellopsis atlantica]|uniref:peptidyl-tRNA hydrolase n=1 Tax=Emericellopsis atlantica TaxID=2614577 RepID=A0A9P7ZRT7_9HYPO|nr:peptidyl-tRNA hydrolase PTH2-domain-containing protein [Emericellopsis atlantica]KAG9256641.1 peptidyl-tRNA hydrolase PTH2-domain-containing protein [Emericellopsis atlantica]
MSSVQGGQQVGIILVTSLATFISGFILGVWSINGYIISPAVREERRRFHGDPVESEESDIDEDDTTLDHAPSWSNGIQADQKQGLRASAPASAAEPKVLGQPNEECKLVLVVRTDLGMTKGKIAAQCSHATLACYKALARHPPKSQEASILSRWERLGQAKIAVQIKSEEEMLELRRKARNAGLTAEVIHDAGRTQIEAGSMTVLGVGPAPKSAVDQITSHLKLL